MMMNLRVKQEGENILLFADNKLVSVIPWDAALEFAKTVQSQAKKAEEIAKADQIISDNALLHRAGSQIGLSSHPKIIQETMKEAVHNRDLRRYLPLVKSMEVVHPPVIRSVSK